MVRKLLPFAFALLCAASGGEPQAMPDLPVAEWSGGSGACLEDFRGQVVALVFYDDNES